MDHYIYKHAVLGGTFDHLHVGHQALLKYAFDKAEKVTVGITHKALQEKTFTQSLEDFSTRKAALQHFLHENGLLKRSRILPLTDIFGPTLTETAIEAIFVTEETVHNADVINQKRQALGLKSLTIIVVPYVHSDDNQIISSERIRSGEINRQGASYYCFLKQKSTYHLPDSLRTQLEQPFGTLYANVDTFQAQLQVENLVFAVGDITSISLKNSSRPPAVCLIDQKTRRHQLDQSLLAQLSPQAPMTLANPAGTINAEIGNVFRSCIQQFIETNSTQVLLVDGEEDLLALPITLLAPLTSYVVYGLYGKGVVAVQVSEEVKEQTKQLISQFS